MYKYTPSTSCTSLQYWGWDIAVTTDRQYTLSGWVYVSPDFDGQYSVSINGEQGFGCNSVDFRLKKGEWQYFSVTKTPTGTTARLLMYPNRGNGSQGSTGYVLFKNIQFTKSNAAYQFYNGTKPHGKIAYDVTMPDISTTMAFKKHLLDTSFKHHALVRNLNSFTYYVDGVATTDFVNKWATYKTKGDMNSPASQGKDINNYLAPLERLYSADPASLGYVWNTQMYGVVFRTFLYLSKAKIINHLYNYDNHGAVYLNGIKIADGTYNSAGNPVSFNLNKGWNCIEICFVDSDSGGGLAFISGADAKFSDKTAHPEIIYMTAELPIEFASNKVVYLSKANCYIDDAVILNNIISAEDLKAYVASGKRLTDPATKVDTPSPSNITISIT